MGPLWPFSGAQELRISKRNDCDRYVSNFASRWILFGRWGARFGSISGFLGPPKVMYQTNRFYTSLLGLSFMPDEVVLVVSWGRLSGQSQGTLLSDILRPKP